MSLLYSCAEGNYGLVYMALVFKAPHPKLMIIYTFIAHLHIVTSATDEGYQSKVSLHRAGR